jgi:hypothetical protein
VAVVALTACSGGDKTGDSGDPVDSATTDTVDTTEPPTDTDEPTGACGDVSRWDLTLDGQVNQPGGGAPGATVRLEERGFQFSPVVYGTTYTDAYGHFSLAATQIVSVDGCWGTLLDYNVVAELGVSSAEAEVNQSLYNAILDGTFAADISLFPLELDN